MTNNIQSNRTISILNESFGLNKENKCIVNKKFIKHFHFLKENKTLIFSLCLFVFSYFLYYLSLEKCLEGFDICSLKVKWITMKLIELIL